MHRDAKLLEEQGGLRLILQAEPLEGNEPITVEQLEAVCLIVYTRALNMGIITPEVTADHANLLRVELPLAIDADEISIGLTERGYLQLADGGEDPPPVGTRISPANSTYSDSLPERPVIISMSDIEGATALLGQFAHMPLVRFSLTEVGGKKLADFTTRNTGTHMLVVVDGQVKCAPRIYDPMTSGMAEVVGLSFWEAARIVAQLKSGPLPVSLKVLEAQQFAIPDARE